MAFLTWKDKRHNVTVVLPLVALTAALVAFALWPPLR